MSKAFTKEPDSGDNDQPDHSEAPPLPGGKNYITPKGFKILCDELYNLKHKERPTVTKTVEWAAGNGDRSENADYTYGKKRLREIDKRMRFLNKRIESAVVVDPATRAEGTEKIYFGATVTIIDEEDNQKTYSIVGIDEVDVGKGRISWISPLGTALLKGSKGDMVSFSSPKGQRDVEIVGVVYREVY